MISVAEARSRLLDGVEPLEAERIAIDRANNRILADDLTALRTQPPLPVSAMDGYAVRALDIAGAPASLTVIGQAAAGHPFDGTVKQGETVRIFTGGVVPDGADTILIQENATVVDDGAITANQSETKGRFIRPAGLDFSEGERLLTAGTPLDAGALCLAAAANHPDVSVVRIPRVAILATGDELLPPGSQPGPGQIIASNSYGVAALVREAGGETTDLGIAADTREALSDALDRAVAARADVIVTLGGASVGDHDLVQETFVAKGMTLDFWKIAMRPGKPLMLGRLDGIQVLGLPGNPVSSLVCTHLFLKPLIARLAGRSAVELRMSALLAEPLPANDRREDYLRALAWRDGAGKLHVRAFDRQDSSMIRIFAEANVLIARPPHAPAAVTGDAVEVVVLKPATI
ncbi:molybdopterin molybdotransferase MoeA [Oricola cellulosilytica]|uniref:Molybdopterin molybdenumtransferase n=1 Tax=Oricola cellulosilytica TaxID=1429082 RepID=A0A4R0P840_9HYPH|nr:gephyrin-like molybdotransferase Glp [Oricola cellulosilytica]TCD13199.1 molybdopterin molybdenumtransferase MoeA [Oricola cellulosilytica]